MTFKRYNNIFRLLFFLFVVYTLLFYSINIYSAETTRPEDSVIIEADAHVDKTEVTIGDEISLEVRVKYKGDLSFQFPEKDQSLGVFSIKKASALIGPVRADNGYSTIIREYVVSSYEIGNQIIPPIKLIYHGIQGQDEVETNEISVTIKGVIKDSENATEIKDISPPIGIPTNYRKLYYCIAVGIAVFVFAWFLYWLIKNREKDKFLPSENVIMKLPHEIAYEQLEELVRYNLIDKGLSKEYYYRLSNILRHYLEDRFGLSAPESTTEEFLLEMTNTDKLKDGHKLVIREFLEHCDMVKYAKYGPSKLEIQETFDIAKKLIDETVEEPIEKEVASK